MVVDTGATGTTFSRATFLKLAKLIKKDVNIEELNKMTNLGTWFEIKRVNIHGIGGTFSTERLVPHKGTRILIDLGLKRKRTLNFIQIQPSPEAPSLLGWDILKELRLELDYPELVKLCEKEKR